MFRKLLVTSLSVLGSFNNLSVLAADEVLLERGAYLTEGIVACGNCHTPKTADAVPIESMQFAGGFVIEEPAFKAYAPNITMDKETGIGSWTDEEIVRSIREGIRPDGTLIGPPMPFLNYRNISDRDVKAIVAYMRTIEPVKNVVPKSDYKIPLPPNWGPPVGNVAEVSKDDPLAYATYVATTLGHCNACHTPMIHGEYDFNRTGMGGNRYVGIFGLKITTVSSNITSHKELGIGNWTDDQIKTAITDGIRPDGRMLAPAMGFPYYKNIDEEDMDALVLYLRSLKPQPAEWH